MSASETTGTHTSEAPHPGHAGAPQPTGGAWWRLGLPLAALAALTVWWSAATVAVIAGIVVIVAVHEAGHLVAARRCGVDATEYSIGVGPLVYSRRAAGLSWSLRAVPVGAFVRVVGMSASDRIDPERESSTYRSATLGRRLAIVLAGPGANFALAAVLLVASLTVWGKVDAAHWVVASVAEGSPAAAAGIEPGERIVAVDGVAVATIDDLIAELSPRGGEQVTVEVDRDGKVRTVTLDVEERLAVWGTVGEDLDLAVADGITVAAVTPGGVVERSGIRAGDRVEAIAGRPVRTAADVAAAVASIDGGTVELGLSRAGGTTPVTVPLGVDVDTSTPRGMIGVSHDTPAVRLSPLEAVPEAATQLVEVGAASAKGLASFLWPPNMASFVSGAVHTPEATVAAPAAASDPAADPNRLLSIVGAVGLGADLASVDPGALLWFMAMMSLFVGLFNLVPLPPFDGGHVTVALYEAARERLSGTSGRHFANPKAVNRVALAVFCVLLCVGAAAIWLDVTNPVS